MVFGWAVHTPHVIVSKTTGSLVCCCWIQALCIQQVYSPHGIKVAHYLKRLDHSLPPLDTFLVSNLTVNLLVGQFHDVTHGTVKDPCYINIPIGPMHNDVTL